MLEKNFSSIVFANDVPAEGLVLEVHRVKPKLREGELIGEYMHANEFLFDFDMSLSMEGHEISNAAGLNAHPVRVHGLNRWTDASMASLKLVFEECYNELFVEGLAER